MTVPADFSLNIIVQFFPIYEKVSTGGIELNLCWVNEERSWFSATRHNISQVMHSSILTWGHHQSIHGDQACWKGGGREGVRPPPVFGRSVNPISTRGGTLSPPSSVPTDRRSFRTGPKKILEDRSVQDLKIAKRTSKDLFFDPGTIIRFFKMDSLEF